ncbi:MAG: TVP38/TMEM64 family protein [Ardenticatenaceae bacterium]|nr:TVP38/TMEM64 family protein [Anaerolineales bacterium]MCB8981983.1 TVP38/TMEM64 family protein [Ardenticatenaceae bacterium]
MSIISEQKAKAQKSARPIQPVRSSATPLMRFKLDGRSKIWLLGISLALLALLTWLLRDSLAGWLNILSDQEFVSSYVQSYGVLAPLVLAFFQVLQVIVAFIPGHVFVIAGGYIYGLYWGLLFNIVCVVAASQLAFMLARWAGRPLVHHLADEQVIEKWETIAEERGFLFFTIAFVLPVFPTDLMNFVAGLTGISPRKFLAANFLGRLPSVLILTLIGSHGLELSNWMWALLALLVAAVYILGRMVIVRIEKKYRPKPAKQ